MKDEVKLILKKIKIVSEVEENGAYICDKEHSKILLEYIEQLHSIIKEVREYIKQVLEIWETKPNEIAELDLEYILKILERENDDTRNI